MSSFRSNYENQALNDWGLRETVSFVPPHPRFLPLDPREGRGATKLIVKRGASH